MKPRISGDVKCKGVSLNRRQRVRVEKEVLAVIRAHADWHKANEIQYWVSFERAGEEPLIQCKIGIICESSVWEDSEYSAEPFKAFRKCLEYLSPTVMLDTA